LRKKIIFNVVWKFFQQTLKKFANKLFQIIILVLMIRR